MPIEFPSASYLDCLPDAAAELVVHREREGEIIERLARESYHGERTSPQNPEELSRLVDQELRAVRFKIFDALLYECLNFRSLARLADRYRARYRHLIWKRAGRPDTDDIFEKFEAQMERRIGKFDEAAALYRIRQLVGHEDIRMDSLLHDITDQELDTFENLVYQRPLKE